MNSASHNDRTNMFSRATRVSSRLCRGSFIGTLLAIGIATTGGGCMLSVEAEVPDVEVTQHDMVFDGIPNAGLLGEVSTGMSFTQDNPSMKLPKGIDSNVQAVRVELHAKTGIKDFTFLRTLRITMSPKDSSAEPIEIINYERPDGAVVGSTLTIVAKNPTNILEQWKTDSAIFTVQIAGNLPENAWTIDASAHFAGTVSYKY